MSTKKSTNLTKQNTTKNSIAEDTVKTKNHVKQTKSRTQKHTHRNTKQHQIIKQA